MYFTGFVGNAILQIVVTHLELIHLRSVPFIKDGQDGL